MAEQSDPIDTLTDKEKQTLRLIVRGHDAKSAARELELSVHTINERLRTARRKLDVTSSREAARLLLEHENGTDKNSVYEALGDAVLAAHPDDRGVSNLGAHKALIAGVIIMSPILLIISLALVSPGSPATETAASSATVITEVTTDTDKEQVAREWLKLVDDGNWRASHDATSTRFRQVLNLGAYMEAFEAARAPLGRVERRKLAQVGALNDGASDLLIVVFRTDFENREGAFERVALEQEAGVLKVSGYWIE